MGEPVWTPYNRSAEGTDAMGARKHYIDNFLGGVGVTPAPSA